MKSVLYTEQCLNVKFEALAQGIQFSQNNKGIFFSFHYSINKNTNEMKCLNIFMIIRIKKQEQYIIKLQFSYLRNQNCKWSF